MLNIFHRQNSGFGLEIGNATIKVLELRKIGKNYKLIGQRREKLPKNAVIDGEIKNEQQVIETIKKAVKHAKPKAIKSQNLALALPENKTFIKNFQIKKLAKEKQEKLITAEIEKYIPLSIHDVYFDWQIIKTTLTDITIFLAACPKKIIDSYQNIILKAGFTAQIFDLEAAAEARVLIAQNPSPKDGISMICDIGKTKTLLIICDNNNIYFTKTTFGICGDVFTKTIAEVLAIKETEAENIKIICCSPKMSDKERKTLTALHSVLDNLASEINKVFDYFQSHYQQSKEINQVILCGGGAATIGIAKYLALKLRKKVKIGNPWQNIPLNASAPLDLTESLIFTKTIGLALRAANL